MGKILLVGMQPALFCLIVGLAASMEAGRLMRDLLHETKPPDQAVLAATTCLK